MFLHISLFHFYVMTVFEQKNLLARMSKISCFGLKFTAFPSNKEENVPNVVMIRMKLAPITCLRFAEPVPPTLINTSTTI